MKRSPRRRQKRQTSQRNPLDGAIQRFQHHWETNRQFRATWSGVIALLMIVLLCSSVGIVGAVATRALAAAGLGSGSGTAATTASVPTGSGSAAGGQTSDTFPTPTSTPGNPGQVPPASPIPDSLTPVPSPTGQPTATPAPTAAATATSGGGGGGSVYNGQTPVCSGGIGNGTWRLNPCPVVHGQGGTLSITDPGDAGKQFNLVLSFGSCGDCTILQTPSSSNTLDGGGNFTLSFTAPSDIQLGAAPVSGMINVTGGASTTFVSYVAK